MNKLQYTFIAILFVSVISMASKCKKPIEPEPIETVYINPEVKAYMYFKTGTWWNYVDTATGDNEHIAVIRDTNYMDYIILKSDTNHRLEGFKWETGNFEFQAHATYWDSTSHDPHAILSKRPLPHSEIISMISFYPFLQKYSVRTDGQSEVTMHKRYDTLEIFGEKYPNVVAFHNNRNLLEGDKQTITYFAKGYGVVRKDIEVERGGKWKTILLYNSNIIQ